MADSRKEFEVSNDALGDAEELSRRLDEEGYLFFRQLLNADKLHQLRLDMLQVCLDGGWLVQGTEVNDGIADISRQCTEGDLEYVRVYHQMYRLESFHRAGHWPEVLEVMAKIVGGPVLPHPQKIARLWFPQYTQHTTPVHQDFVHFQGSFDTYTCWAPVGDCPVELGGLGVLRGSHKVAAVHEHHFSLGAGGLAIAEEDLEGEWVTTDYEIGDALIFNSLMVHQALPNLTEDRLRVSLDNRYQEASLPIAEHMLEPHLQAHNNLQWEEVYRDWKSSELQYYWQKMDLKTRPRDGQWGEKGFAEALELASQGDERAEFQLRRMIRRDPTTEQAASARRALGQ